MHETEISNIILHKENKWNVFSLKCNECLLFTAYTETGLYNVRTKDEFFYISLSLLV